MGSQNSPHCPQAAQIQYGEIEYPKTIIFDTKRDHPGRAYIFLDVRVYHPLRLYILPWILGSLWYESIRGNYELNPRLPRLLGGYIFFYERILDQMTLDSNDELLEKFAESTTSPVNVCSIQPTTKRAPDSRHPQPNSN